MFTHNSVDMVFILFQKRLDAAGVVCNPTPRPSRALVFLPLPAALPHRPPARQLCRGWGGRGVAGGCRERGACGCKGPEAWSVIISYNF